MYCFGGESVKIMLKLSVRVITELFILKMKYYFTLLEIKSKEKLPKFIQNAFLLNERRWKGLILSAPVRGPHMLVLEECLIPFNSFLIPILCMMNDYALISHASLALCHMPVFLHKCTKIKIMQQTSNGPVSEKCKKVAEITLFLFGPQSGWRSILCV